LRGADPDLPNLPSMVLRRFALVIENRKKQRFLAKRSLIFSLTDQRGQPRLERIDGVERSVAGLQPQR
jgi:hypothetical protein